MVALQYLKYTYDLSDEQVCEGWVENPYWQSFGGNQYFEHSKPIHPTSMTNFRKRIGEAGAEEQNGTYDMMGNVAEWTESASDGDLDSMAETRSRRGGLYSSPVFNMISSWRFGSYPAGENGGVGFRVAAIPEPSSIAMIGLVSGCAVFIRRRFMI